MLCLSVYLILYCPHCLPPTSQGQAGNKERDRQTNRALISFLEFFGSKALVNKFVALIVKEGQIRLEVDKEF